MQTEKRERKVEVKKNSLVWFLKSGGDVELDVDENRFRQCFLLM